MDVIEAQSVLCETVHSLSRDDTPNVLGTPNPASSVMMSKILGAFLGGTTRGAHHAFDSNAFSLITPPNGGSGAGSCLPLMVVVALGEPSVPVTSTAEAWAAVIITAPFRASTADATFFVFTSYLLFKRNFCFLF